MQKGSYLMLFLKLCKDYFKIYFKNFLRHPFGEKGLFSKSIVLVNNMLSKIHQRIYC